MVIGCSSRSALYGHASTEAVIGPLPSGDMSHSTAFVDSPALKYQLLILNHSRERAPKRRPMDRVIAGLCAAAMRAARLIRSAIALRPSTLWRFHRALVKRSYRLLFTPKRR